MKKIYSFSLRAAISFFCLMILSQTGFAQRADFFITKVDTSNFPVMRADFTATDAEGKWRTDVDASNFRVFENETRIDPALVSTKCDEVKLDPEVSVILVMDRSLSMDMTYNGEADRIEWLQYAGVTFIDNLNFAGRTTVAITKFGSLSDLVINFTNDKQALRDSLLTIKAGGTTNYNLPFLHEFNGVINLFKSRPAGVRKVVIFMTDGDPDPNIYIKQQAIIDSLLQYNIQVFSVALALPTNDFLYTVPKLTGGKSFNAYTRQELANIYKLLALETQFTQKCYLQWVSPYTCSEFDRIRNLEVTFVPIPKTENKVFTVPARTVATLQASESILSFGAVPIGKDSILPVTITAKSADFLVSSLEILPQGFFTIGGITVNGSPRTTPFVLPAGQSMEVKVIFNQKVSQVFRQAELFVNSTPCAQRITLVGGLSQVRLISPNGDKPGDVIIPFKTCDTIDIQWSGVGKTDPVNLYYSTSNGSPTWNWIPIANAVQGLSYKWKAPQTGKTYRIKVEVAQKKSWLWSRQFGATGDDGSAAIDVTADKFFAYIGGHFEETIEFPPGSPLPTLTSKGRKDIFVSRYDTDGNLLWTATAGGTKDDQALAVVTDPSNNVYVSGSHTQGAFFGSQQVRYQDNDSANFFVAKYNGISTTPQWVVYGNGRGPAYRSASKASRVAYGVDKGIEYVYVNIDYKYYVNVEGISSTINLGNGSATEKSVILRIPAATPYNAVIVPQLPAGVKFSADPKFDTDGNQNDYYTGKFTTTLKAGFDPTYNMPGIPDLTTRGKGDAFIAKSGAVPGSSDSSDNVFSVESPVIQLTSVSGTFVTAEDIGSIAVGQPLQKILKATIKNTGTMDILLDSAKFFGVNATEFTPVSSISGIVLKVDSSTTIELAFTPTAEGVRTAELTIFGSCDAIASITVNGFGLPPCSTDPLPIVAFGTVGLNITDTKTAIPCLFKFKGLVPVRIKPLLKGNDANYFKVTYLSHTPDANDEILLKPDECLSGTITFTPTEARTYQAYIEYEGLGNCGLIITQLGGNGLKPNLSIDNKDWGIKRMLTVNSGTIFLKNNDSVDAIINSIKLSDPASQDFKYSITTPANIVFPYVLKKNDRVEIAVTFTPTSATGFLSTNVEVEVNSVQELLKGNLQGIGFLPVIEALDQSFKPVLVGTTSAENISVQVRNLSKDSSLYIEKIEVVQNDGNDFTFDGSASFLKTNLSITASGSMPIAVTFTPSAAGMRIAKLRIISDAKPGPESDPRDTTFVTITGEGLDITQIDVEPFKKTLTCETPSRVISISNPAATELLVITGFTQVSGNPGAFTIQPGSLTIAPLKSSDVTVTFTPAAVGNYSADFKVENSFGKDLHIKVSGTARTAALELAVDPVTGVAPGDKINVPVKFTSEDYGTIAVTALTFTLKFDPLLLNIGKVNGLLGWNFTTTPLSTGLVEISGNGPALQSNVLKTSLMTIEFEVFLTKENSSAIEISDVKTGFNCIIPKTVNSSFAYGEICFQDSRLIHLGITQYQLQEVHPNPVSSNEAVINYGVGIDGRTVINLHSATGVLVATIVDNNLLAGEYETIITLENIPAGVYFYTMNSGPYSETRKLVIVK
ncbi:MAG: choice-of-anchor D domain-containing protein [Bacteroidota bacterium]